LIHFYKRDETWIPAVIAGGCGNKIIVCPPEAQGLT